MNAPGLARRFFPARQVQLCSQQLEPILLKSPSGQLGLVRIGPREQCGNGGPAFDAELSQHVFGVMFSCPKADT
jgi:hypothetical protein